MSNVMINKKALGIFLGLTFSATLCLIFAARLLGFTLFDKPVLLSQMFILGAMFVPGVSAIITQKIVVKKPLRELGFTWGPWQMYLKTYALIVFLFAVNYTIAWLFVLRPDFSLMSFLQQYNVSETLPLPAPLMIALFSGLTFLLAPIINIIPSLGEEVGWRGFLLPQLEPLGRIRALIISGMIWAAWHTPMILIMGFTYGREIWFGALVHFILVTSFGIWMGQVWLKTRSTVLAAFMHATFNANNYGIWAIIFVTDSKLIIGGTGVIGASLFAVLGALTLYVYQGKDD